MELQSSSVQWRVVFFKQKRGLQMDWGVTRSAMALVGLGSTSKNRLAEALK